MRIKQHAVAIGEQLAINATQAEEAKLAQALDSVKAQLLAAARAERSQLLAQAQQDAEAIIQQAHAKAQQWLEAAQAQQDELRATAEQAGYEAGFTQGRADGLSDVMAGANALLTTLKDGEARLFYGIRRDLAQLIEAICLQVLQQHLALQPDNWLTLVDAAIAQCTASKQVTVVMPESLVNQIQTLCSGNDHFRLLPDKQLKPGQAYLITDTHALDLSLDTQVQALLATIRPETWVETSPALLQEIEAEQTEASAADLTLCADEESKDTTL